MIREFNLNEIATVTGGVLLQGNPAPQIAYVGIDSRQLVNPYKTLFVALRGAKADGADFIDNLVEQGVRSFLVHADFDPKNFPKEVGFISVSDTRIGLQMIAKAIRDEFAKPVISITGSNGKTIVKEWLGQVLGQKFAVAKSPKSYNSQVGVPLSVFGIEAYHQLAILEAGISKSGEMKALEAIIRPDLGIFTTIGTAHQEGFSSIREKILEKLKLFSNSKLLIYCKDQELVRTEIERLFSEERRISWSDQSGAEYTRSIKQNGAETRMILIKKDSSTYTFRIPFTDPASLENITHVIIAAITLGMQTDEIQEGIAYLKSVDMRLTLKPGVNDCLLIDDTYNNDLAGLRVALDFMQQQRPKKRKMLILSDLLQQGEPQVLYREVSDLLRRYEIDKILGVGKDILVLGQDFGNQFSGFDSTAELLSQLVPDDFYNDLILITGARPFGFETVVNRLQQRIHGTTLEINFNALTHNFNFYKRKLNPETKVMVMVKAFAYGGGSVEIANHLQTMGVDYLAVAFSDEGVALRKQGIRLPIMVLNPAEESFELCAAHHLEPVVFSPEIFRSLAAWCEHHQSSMIIHLDLDTGMHRLGFGEKQLEELKELVIQNPQLKVASIYTHLVGADEEIHRDYSINQLKQFEKMSEELSVLFEQKPLLHALNSAGILAFPSYQFDMVRLGIGLYGVEVTGKNEQDLRAISTLKTTISQVKAINPGDTVGYSRKGLMKEGGKIATLSIGYADGFDRRFSNGKGYVLIHGKKALVIGNICMDMCMVDVTDIPCKAGDEAVIYGEDISLRNLADRIGTIPYELLTNISTRVKRVYYLD